MVHVKLCWQCSMHLHLGKIYIKRMHAKESGGEYYFFRHLKRHLFLVQLPQSAARMRTHISQYNKRVYERMYTGRNNLPTHFGPYF
jgi:hypothetical protein